MMELKALRSGIFVAFACFATFVTITDRSKLMVSESSIDNFMLLVHKCIKCKLSLNSKELTCFVYHAKCTFLMFFATFPIHSLQRSAIVLMVTGTSWPSVTSPARETLWNTIRWWFPFKLQVNETAFEGVNFARSFVALSYATGLHFVEKGKRSKMWKSLQQLEKKQNFNLCKLAAVVQKMTKLLHTWKKRFSIFNDCNFSNKVKRFNK